MRPGCAFVLKVAGNPSSGTVKWVAGYIGACSLGVEWGHCCLWGGKVPEITQRECISWKVKAAKKGMKAGKRM